MVPTSVPQLNNSVKPTLAGKARILGKIRNFELKDKELNTDDHPFGEDVKMIRHHKLQSRLLTPTEQDEAVAKYQTGMTMTAIANLYGCHRTTIRKLLIASCQTP